MTTTPKLTEAEAIKLVADDVRESYPELTDEQAIEHVRNTVFLDDVYGDDDLAQAYRLVLRSAPHAS